MRTLLLADKITKNYGRQIVLDGLSFVIADRERIGLIGRNGSGKTTLLKIMAGLEMPDTGSVRTLSGVKLGTIAQDEVMPDDVSTLAFLAASSGHSEWECERMAASFGLKGAELIKPPAALSGGYQMRVKLARMLLGDPHLILLDEPVNYLDLPTLLLLEGRLRRFTGAILVTSHDRAVLQDLCTTTWEIAEARLTTFDGDLETYLKWKAEQEAYALRTNKRLRREIAHTQEFVDRFKYKASQASRAQSKMKQISKLRLKLRDLGPDAPLAAFSIPCPSVPSGSAVRCEDLAVGYGERVVAEGISLEIQRGAKVAIVGENGRGKTTLLRTLAGRLPPLGGKMQWWHRADIGYYAQLAEETLRPQETIMEALTRAAPPDATPERLMAAAGAFLFHDDDLEKQCGVLSGGEKARVRLAQLTLGGHNTLILDEPTNHLDVETVAVLSKALKDYEGTVITVSHSRSFMAGLADRIYEVRAGGVRQFPGTYEEYVAQLTQFAAEADTLPSVDDGRPDAVVHQEAVRESRAKQRERQRIEKILEKAESEKSRILAWFFENPTEYEPDKQRRLSELEAEIGELERKWMDLAS